MTTRGRAASAAGRVTSAVERQTGALGKEASAEAQRHRHIIGREQVCGRTAERAGRHNVGREGTIEISGDAFAQAEVRQPQTAQARLGFASAHGHDPGAGRKTDPRVLGSQ